MAAYLLPVGFDVGLTYEPGGDLSTATGTVRVGDRLHDLEAQLYRTWAQSGACLGRADLLRRLDQPPESAHRHLTDLQARGLLIEVDPAGDRPLEQLASLTLIATGVGLGNRPDKATHHLIGPPGGPAVISLPTKAFLVWAMSWRGTIAQVCRQVTGEGGSADGLAAALAGYLPALISHGCGYLDHAASSAPAPPDRAQAAQHAHPAPARLAADTWRDAASTSRAGDSGQRAVPSQAGPEDRVAEAPPAHDAKVPDTEDLDVLRRQLQEMRAMVTTIEDRIAGPRADRRPSAAELWSDEPE